MFTGWSIHALDAKGRLAIPARFREVLKGTGDERMVLTTSKRCLMAYPVEEWRSIAEKVARLSRVDPKVLAFRRYHISGAIECLCDKQGRILIPQPLRERAGLDGQVYLVGMQHNFEIWDKDRWLAEWDSIDSDYGDLSSSMAELGV